MLTSHYARPSAGSKVKDIVPQMVYYPFIYYLLSIFPMQVTVVGAEFSEGEKSQTKSL